MGGVSIYRFLWIPSSSLFIVKVLSGVSLHDFTCSAHVMLLSKVVDVCSVIVKKQQIPFERLF